MSAYLHNHSCCLAHLCQELESKIQIYLKNQKYPFFKWLVVQGAHAPPRIGGAHGGATVRGIWCCRQPAAPAPRACSLPADARRSPVPVCQHGRQRQSVSTSCIAFIHTYVESRINHLLPVGCWRVWGHVTTFREHKTSLCPVHGAICGVLRMDASIIRMRKDLQMP